MSRWRFEVKGRDWTWKKGEEKGKNKEDRLKERKNRKGKGKREQGRENEWVGSFMEREKREERKRLCKEWYKKMGNKINEKWFKKEKKKRDKKGFTEQM